MFVTGLLTGAAAGIADQPDIGVLQHVVGDRLERVRLHHGVPVVQVTEQERHVHQRRHLREGRHVRRRDDGVVHRDALAHVLEIILLEAELGIEVQLELDVARIALLGQFLELAQRLGEGVVLVELYGADQRDGLGRSRADRHHRAAGEQGLEGFHDAASMLFSVSWTDESL